MKKILTLALAILLATSSVCGCIKKDDKTSGGIGTNDNAVHINNEENNKEPEIYTAPEKIASLGDMRQLTIKSEIHEKGSITKYTDGFDAASDIKTRYYQKSVADGEIAEFICDVSADGQACYVKEESAYVQGIGVNKKEKDYYLSEYEKFGFGYENLYKEATFVKLEDRKVLGKDCFGYLMSAVKDGNNITAEISVDKKSGIWLATEHTGGTEEYRFVVTEVVNDALAVPGVTPAGVENGLFYKDAKTANIEMKIESISYDDPNNAAVITLLLKNKGLTTPVKVTSETFSINGICLGASVISLGCRPKSEATTVIEIPNSALEIAGIDIIGEISATLRVSAARISFDGDSEWFYETQSFTQNQKASCRTDCKSYNDNKTKPAGKEIINRDGLTAIVTDFEVTDAESVSITVYTENKTSVTYRTAIKIVTLDGTETNFSDNIVTYANSKSYDRITVNKKRLTDAGIEPSAVKSAELTYEVKSGNTYDEIQPRFSSDGKIEVNIRQENE